MVKKCPYCRSEIEENIKICPYCEGKLKSEPKIVLFYATCVLLAVNCLIPCLLGKLMNDYPQYWAKMSFDDISDFYSLITSFAIFSAIPAIVGIFKDYKKKFFIASLVLLLVLCLIDAIILAGVR